MSDKLITEVTSPAEESNAERKPLTRLRWTTGVAAVAIAAASFTLMVLLIHAPGLLEGAAVIVGVTALAGGIAYTIQKFVRGPVKCRAHGDDEEI